MFWLRVLGDRCHGSIKKHEGFFLRSRGKGEDREMRLFREGNRNENDQNDEVYWSKPTLKTQTIHKCNTSSRSIILDSTVWYSPLVSRVYP